MTNPTTPEIPDGLEKRLREYPCSDYCECADCELTRQAADALARARVALGSAARALATESEPHKMRCAICMAHEAEPHSGNCHIGAALEAMK